MSTPAALRAALASLVGQEVQDAGQRIFGLTLDLGPVHLAVTTTEDAVKVNAALTHLGVLPSATPGQIDLEPESWLMTQDGLWSMRGPGAFTTGYDYTLTGAGEDPAEVAATEAALAHLVGRRTTAACLEEDGTLTLSFGEFVVTVWPPTAAPHPDDEPLDWKLVTGDDVWEGRAGSVEHHHADDPSSARTRFTPGATRA